MGLGGFEATMRKLTIGSIAALALIGLYFLALYVIFPIPGASLGELEEYAVGSGQEDLARLLAATDEITAAVKKHEGLALFSEPFEWADPREQSFRLPSELLQAIDNGNRRAYPLEVAALAAAMTRSRAGGRLHAKIVEVLEFEGLRSPDPSGRLGYYLIEIEGERHDVFGLGGGKEATRVRVLDDREALGAAIAVKAFIELTQGGEIGEGIRATRRARELDPKSPSIRAIEGTILISAGEIDDGERELQAALSLGADPARKNILAGFRMSMGDLRAADQIISEALREDPELAPAYVTRAAIDLSMEQPYAARRALERAETLDPTLPSLPILFAQLDLMEGRPTEALRRVREQIAAHPDDAQTHLAALPIFKRRIDTAIFGVRFRPFSGSVRPSSAKCFDRRSPRSSVARHSFLPSTMSSRIQRLKRTQALPEVEIRMMGTRRRGRRASNFGSILRSGSRRPIFS